MWEFLSSRSSEWVVPLHEPASHGFSVDAGETKAQRRHRGSERYASGEFFARKVAFLIFKGSRSSTLFVSNLPFSVTSTDLKTLFSDIAPVRNAFVVLEHGTGVSKGVGYVSFAIKEDVQLALEKISSQGLTIDGRGLRAELAVTRQRDKDTNPVSGGNVDADAKPAKARKAKNPRIVVSAAKDPFAIRTVVLSGLPSSIDAKVLWKKVRKQEGAEKVDWPAKLQTGDEDPTQGLSLLSPPEWIWMTEGRNYSSTRAILRSQNRPGSGQKTPRPHLQRFDNIRYPQEACRQPPETRRIRFCPCLFIISHQTCPESREPPDRSKLAFRHQGRGYQNDVPSLWTHPLDRCSQNRGRWGQGLCIRLDDV